MPNQVTSNQAQHVCLFSANNPLPSVRTLVRVWGVMVMLVVLVMMVAMVVVVVVTIEILPKDLTLFLKVK